MIAVVALLALPLLWCAADLPEFSAQGDDGLPDLLALAACRGLWRAGVLLCAYALWAR